MPHYEEPLHGSLVFSNKILEQKAESATNYFKNLCDFFPTVYNNLPDYLKKPYHFFMVLDLLLVFTNVSHTLTEDTATSDIAGFESAFLTTLNTYSQILLSNQALLAIRDGGISLGHFMNQVSGAPFFPLPMILGIIQQHYTSYYSEVNVASAVTADVSTVTEMSAVDSTPDVVMEDASYAERPFVCAEEALGFELIIMDPQLQEQAEDGARYMRLYREPVRNYGQVLFAQPQAILPYALTVPYHFFKLVEIMRDFGTCDQDVLLEEIKNNVSLEHQDLLFTNAALLALQSGCISFENFKHTSGQYLEYGVLYDKISAYYESYQVSMNMDESTSFGEMGYYGASSFGLH